MGPSRDKSVPPPPSLRLHRVFLERDGSAKNIVKLPWTKYTVYGSPGEGSWALLERSLAAKRGRF